MAMFPKRAAPYVFGFLLSGSMTFFVSGCSTFVALGVAPGFVRTWMGAWAFAWTVAFPAVLLVRPFVQRMTDRLTGTNSQMPR